MDKPPIYLIVRAFLAQARRERSNPTYLSGLPRLYVGVTKNVATNLPFAGNACQDRGGELVRTTRRRS